jgi:hypothetical protein
MNIQQKQIEVRHLLDQIKRQAIKDLEQDPDHREPSAEAKELTKKLTALMEIKND